jgi:hypothetical protein
MNTSGTARAAWDKIAKEYDRTNTPTHMWLGNEGLRRAELRSGTGRVHSSMSGARHWDRPMDDFRNRFHVRARFLRCSAIEDGRARNVLPPMIRLFRKTVQRKGDAP